MNANMNVFKHLLLLTALFSVRAFSNNIEDNNIDSIIEYVVTTEEKFQGIQKSIHCKNEQLASILNDNDENKDDISSTLNQNGCSEKLVSQLEAIITQLAENTAAIKILQNQLDTLNSLAPHKVNATQQQETEMASLAINCVPYENSMNIHEIEITGLGQMEVLCDGQTVGPGWLVVQRRFDGSENFYRNWSMYSEGFGDLEGEFFIGLEKLHRLTTSLPYELYIELVAFNGERRFARYGNFQIGSKEERYMLKDLGTYSGNAGDAFSYNLLDSFTTFDQDNDQWVPGNCAQWYESGGWFNLYGNSNLNGKYFDDAVHNQKSIWWYPWKGYQALQSVKMLIRPKYCVLK